MTAPSLTRRQAMRAAALAWQSGCAAMDRMTPSAAARACYVPDGPSLAELEAAIRADRVARALLHRAAA
jgi:hypothetical protein